MAKKKVDFTELFLYKQELEIKKDEEVIATVHQRLLNDADVEYARAQAFRASGQHRKALRDENSDEYFAYISPVSDLDRDEMLATIILYEVQDRKTRLGREVLPIIPKRPEAGASLEKQEKYQEELDNADKTWQEKINERLEKELKKRKEELVEIEDGELFRTLQRITVEGLCSVKMVNMFQNWSTYLGTYSNKACTKRYFSSYEEFTQQPTEVLTQLIGGYFELGLGVDEVKK